MKGENSVIYFQIGQMLSVKTLRYSGFSPPEKNNVLCVKVLNLIHCDRQMVLFTSISVHLT